MKIIRQNYNILTPISDGGVEELNRIENIARTAYKSENALNGPGVDKTLRFEQTKKFIGNLVKKGHESVLEHSSLSVQFTTDRGVTHELVRHRLAAFTQESTRYCNYSKDKFGNECTFILPVEYEKVADIPPDSFIKGPEIDRWIRYETWKDACSDAERKYFKLLDEGATPQEARGVLPNSLKADIVVTANYREWRHVLKLRTAPDAHPQIQALTGPLLDNLKSAIPVIFDDI